jgi:hypothetical protein
VPSTDIVTRIRGKRITIKHQINASNKQIQRYQENQSKDQTHQVGGDQVG